MAAKVNSFVEGNKYNLVCTNNGMLQSVLLGNHPSGHQVSIDVIPENTSLLYLGFNYRYHIARTKDDRMFYHFASRSAKYSDIPILTLVDTESPIVLQGNDVSIDGNSVFEGFAPYFDDKEIRRDNYRQTRLKLLRFLGRLGI